MMRGLRRRLSCALLAALAAPWLLSDAQQRSPQQQRTPEEYARFLEEAARVARLQVPRVVDALGVKAGMRVADLGAGSGLFARPLAKAVAPGGTVYAVDIDAPLLAILASRAAEAGVRNITTIVGRPDDPMLPTPVDLVLICDALHHIENQAAYLKVVRRSLAPGGRVAIIDFSAAWPEGHEPMRFSEAQFEGWMAGAGFTRVASHEWIQDSFFKIYR